MPRSQRSEARCHPQRLWLNSRDLARSFKNIKTLGREVDEVWIADNSLKHLGLAKSIHRLAIFPGVNTAIGIALLVTQPGL